MKTIIHFDRSNGLILSHPPSGQPQGQRKNVCDKKGRALANEVKKGGALENEGIKVIN